MWNQERKDRHVASTSRKATKVGRGPATVEPLDRFQKKNCILHFVKYVPSVIFVIECLSQMNGLATEKQNRSFANEMLLRHAKIVRRVFRLQ